MSKFEFNRVPFGLAQAPEYFLRLINEVLTDCNFAMGYLDDIIIFSKTEEEHLQHLEEILECLWKAGLKLKLGGLLGLRVVRVSGMAETECALGKPSV